MSNCPPDFEPVLSQIPGPRGPAGTAAVAPAAPISGRAAYTTTTSPFVMPSAGANATVTVADSAWVPVGLTIFIEAAGYFKVITVTNVTTLVVQASAVPSNTAGGTTIATGKRVSPGGIAYIDQSAISDITNRVYALETATGGITTYFATTPPTGPQRKVGDLWFDTDDGNKLYRWDGAAWVSATRLLDRGDFGSGVRPVRYFATFASLPTTGNTSGDLAFANDNKKLYRWTGTAWTSAAAGGDIVGTVDGALVANLTAGSFAYGLAIGDKLAANDVIIRNEAQIAEATVKSAHIQNLEAGKITAGDMASVNIGYAGRIFHPQFITGAFTGRYFRAMDFGTKYQDPKNYVAGNCLLAAYAHGTPVVAFGPGNPGWTVGGVTVCPDSDGRARVMLAGRIIDYTGNLLLYCQVNAATPVALSAKYSTDGEISATRFLSGLTPMDSVKFFVAPADGAGVVVPTSARFELDVTVFNW